DGVLGSRSTATVAADTFGAMHKVFRFLDLTYHRAGLDKSNSPKVRALVHHPSDPTNWNSRDSAILVARDTPEHYDMASLDVIAHELAHGLNDQGPKLVLSGEAGKVSESTADMFAMLVSHKEWPYDPLPYRIGELTLKNNQSMDRALTYMDAPSLKTGTVTCYTSDIGTLENHRGAGPGDHMFYLLVYGGMSLCNSSFVQGIGFEAATTIWQKAFFGLNESSGYSALRQQFIAAAQDYANGPSTVVSSTIAAFDAVEIP
ncbi:MAG TPA: M4 family metallopeptidase, partial [Thermoanaerobaculia bacterium]|nr:M4 family metallopeptidase [Thermoanaerobaculia bacterium]